MVAVSIEAVHGTLFRERERERERESSSKTACTVHCNECILL
jgi:hypothetical protein